MPDLFDMPTGRDTLIVGTGFLLNLETFDCTGLSIEDVALTLSQKSRWGGACQPSYSVAEHSIHVSRLVPGYVALAGLFDDADEILYGDIPTPIKDRIGKEHLMKLKRPFMRQLARRFGIKHLGHPAIKIADGIAAATEFQQRLPWRWIDMTHLPPSDTIDLPAMSPDQAAQAFIKRYQALA